MIKSLIWALMWLTAVLLIAEMLFSIKLCCQQINNCKHVQNLWKHFDNVGTNKGGGEYPLRSTASKPEDFFRCIFENKSGLLLHSTRAFDPHECTAFLQHTFYVLCLIQEMGQYIWRKWNSLPKIKLNFAFNIIMERTYWLKSSKHQKSAKVHHHCAWERQNLRSNNRLQRKANKVSFFWDLCLGKESKRKTSRGGNNENTSFSRQTLNQVLKRKKTEQAHWFLDELSKRCLERQKSFRYMVNDTLLICEDRILFLCPDNSANLRFTIILAAAKNYTISS